MTDALFAPNGDGHFTASSLTTGPWDRSAQHGGAPASLLMRAFEALPAAGGLQIARVTYEFMRPVPVGELTLQAEVARGGRRVQLLEASLHAADGTEVVRARALQVQAAETRSPSPTADGDPELPAPPDAGRPNDIEPHFRPMFAPDAMEVRFVDGSFRAPGPSTAWFRLSAAVVPGEHPSPLQRLAAAGDFGNGIASPLSWDDHMFINPDLTLYVERPPRGEWIGLRSRMRIHEGGLGLAESELFDAEGRVGRATQALLVQRR